MIGRNQCWITGRRGKPLVTTSLEWKSFVQNKNPDFSPWERLRASLPPYLLNCISWYFLPTTALLNEPNLPIASCSLKPVCLGPYFFLGSNLFYLKILFSKLTKVTTVLGGGGRFSDPPGQKSLSSSSSLSLMVVSLIKVCVYVWVLP